MDWNVEWNGMDSTINRSTRTDSYIITNGNQLLINLCYLQILHQSVLTGSIASNVLTNRYKQTKSGSIKMEAEIQMHVICVD